MADLVNHPPHYTYGKIEVIDVLEDWKLGYHEACAVKYIARAKHKGNEKQDLEKARWYLDRKIAELEAAAEPRRCQVRNFDNNRRCDLEVGHDGYHKFLEHVGGSERWSKNIIRHCLSALSPGPDSAVVHCTFEEGHDGQHSWVNLLKA